MHWSIMVNLLLEGTFHYTETGLLDYDHKHLFTQREIEQLFCNCDFQLDEINFIKLSEIP